LERERFWSILESAGQGGDGGHARNLQRALTNLPPEDILGFYRCYEDLVDAAYGVDLWGAAYTINGGCSDDGFHYFRIWLVSMGRRIYTAALHDPDSLAEVVDPEEGPCEGDLDHAARQAWLKKTKRKEEELFEELSRLERRPGQDLEGEDWDYDDEEELRRRLPRLSRMYLEGPGPDGK
jgi:hypothetical protein